MTGLALLLAAAACATPAAVCPQGDGRSLSLIDRGVAPRVIADTPDDPGVARVAAALAGDLARVAGSARTDPRLAVIVGTVGQSPVIDRLAAAGAIDVKPLAGRWEGFLQQVVEAPMPGVDRALVIAGADRRGAIFGAYDLSRRAGVSPWHWWADVPVAVRPRLFVAPGARIDAPKVRYRGIFLNDEEPALAGWAKARFGGVDHRFYEHVFDLILRLRGNLLWPAMWGKSLWQDDPASAALAERMGVVLGTSHHEPLLRAHVEWERAGGGAWNYATNAAVLRRFWREGLVRNAGREALVTVGMRGDGDEPMTQGTAIPLLERIVADQRALIADVTGRPAAATPQVWALYKEVQDYYDQGMRVPDDVTLLFADDNWGNIRRLPAPGDRRAGGSGVYYHFDYVGGPRNYKWLNVTQVSRVWEQMRLAYAHGVDRLWITNVGDLKPMELPTSFFLDLAWNPDAWPAARIGDYTREWAAEQFGEVDAAPIADILDRVTRYAARRKPELLSPDSWSLDRHDESARVAAEYDRLEADAEAVERRLAPALRDAYLHLVLHPVLATANLDRLYRTVALNRRHAAQGRADTDALAAEAERLFARDRAIRARYEATAGGKWPQMMAQTHIGYTGWQQPATDVMPAVRRLAVPAGAALGVAVEGQASAWTPGAPAPSPTTIDRYGRQSRRLELFARGRAAFDYTVTTTVPWLRIDRPRGGVAGTAAVTISVDWAKAPTGRAAATLAIAGAGASLALPVAIDNRAVPAAAGFIEADGVIAIETIHARALPADAARWIAVPGLGRTGSAMTIWPQTMESATPGAGPALAFDLFVTAPGDKWLSLIASPSLAVTQGRGLRYAIAVDDEKPQVVDLAADASPKGWETSVIAAARIGASRHRLTAGRHVVRVWAVDPGVVAQRLLVTATPVDPLALGPPESARR